MGYHLHFARKHPGEDGGEQNVMATDRRIGFWKARDQPPTIDYPFTLIDPAGSWKPKAGSCQLSFVPRGDRAARLE